MTVWRWHIKYPEYHGPLSWQGEDIYKRIEALAASEKAKIKIAQNKPNKDAADLAKYSGVEVRSLNWTALMGAGILHSKMLLVDRRHFYVGSANLIWRSFTQQKEMGVMVLDCPILAGDFKFSVDEFNFF